MSLVDFGSRSSLKSLSQHIGSNQENTKNNNNSDDDDDREIINENSYPKTAPVCLRAPGKSNENVHVTRKDCFNANLVVLGGPDSPVLYSNLTSTKNTEPKYILAGPVSNVFYPNEKITLKKTLRKKLSVPMLGGPSSPSLYDYRNVKSLKDIQKM
ncbi:uncharacterized protein ASCRUDRAFT_77111 [Ascoidea rubescens DSM 1968]|uniref:Uncharacterized protein n=1 Tax=Ascoidea rubescens DSM 1968 TaxID=1344418 RepID=A0A1D2VD22_9ASCO|nr:hypothetical protein ASCRUDRAFT_77111 [Ascoidea rubescens DSM 1968]ODV59367.1 hypothetical protein ASCRUDRAFT_77111 [Ascoidea rubescens DSM 1968]